MEPTPLLPGSEWIPFWERRQEDTLGQRQVTGSVGVLATLVWQCGVSRRGCCVGTCHVYSRELISVAENAYRYHVCSCMCACHVPPPPLLLSLCSPLLLGIFRISVREAATPACLSLFEFFKWPCSEGKVPSRSRIQAQGARMTWLCW